MAALKQQIAQKQDELSRLKEQMKKQDTSQKIVIDGLVLAEAKRNPKVVDWLKRIQPIRDTLIQIQNTGGVK